MTDKELKDAADRIIGAAQELEKTAKVLRDCARSMRKWGVSSSVDYKLWMMHRCYDVQRSQDRALAELGELDKLRA